MEHNGEEILITPESRGDLDCVLNNVETKALMSAGLQSNLISVESLKPPNESNISPAAPTFGAALTGNAPGDQAAPTEVCRCREGSPLTKVSDFGSLFIASLFKDQDTSGVPADGERPDSWPSRRDAEAACRRSYGSRKELTQLY